MQFYIFLFLFNLLLQQNKNQHSQPEVVKENKMTRSVSDGKWRAVVSLEDNPPPKNYYLLEEIFFIQKGVANVHQEYSQAYRYWTQIALDMPCDKQFSADAIQLEWRGKSALSIGLDESDMGGFIVGEKDTAAVNCITYYRPPFSIFRYGSKLLTDVPEIVLNPSSWAIYSIQIRDKKMSFTKNGKVLKILKADQVLGKVKSIFLHFKGSGYIDWVKFYHKNLLVMQEDFELEGKSSVQWK
jgi:hypothetical protein